MTKENCFEMAKKALAEGKVKMLRVSYVCLRSRELMLEHKVDRGSAMREANREFKELNYK